MQGNLKVMLENVLIFKETGQITNPKLQISNKLQIPNINTKSQTKKGIFFCLVIRCCFLELICYLVLVIWDFRKELCLIPARPD